jgi:hypothetical protein
MGMSITEIKTAIEGLSEEERCELSAWFLNLPMDDWDRQMQQDAKPGGKLHQLAREAAEEYRRGECRPFT